MNYAAILYYYCITLIYLIIIYLLSHTPSLPPPLLSIIKIQTGIEKQKKLLMIFSGILCSGYRTTLYEAFLERTEIKCGVEEWGGGGDFTFLPGVEICLYLYICLVGDLSYIPQTAPHFRSVSVLAFFIVYIWASRIICLHFVQCVVSK